VGRGEHTPCFHCLDTGGRSHRGENNYGGLEDYFVVLWRRCKEGA
jgi:hypothetical protein